jgi:hypothetical protein
MKATLPYWLSLCIFLFAGDLLSQELTLDNLTVEENLPAGTVVGTFQVPEGTKKIWLSGIQDVAMNMDTCLIVREGGELWSLYCKPNRFQIGQSGQRVERPAIYTKTLARIFDSGIESIAAHSIHNLIIREDGSLWGFMHHFHLMDKPLNFRPFKEQPFQLFGSGIKKVDLNDKVILALGHDGSLWSIEIKQQLQEGESPYSQPVQLVKSGVVDISVDLDIYLFVKDDGSLWRWTEDHTYGLDYGQFKSSSPVKIVSNGVLSCDANLEALYVRDDQSAWSIWVDPSKPHMSMGCDVRSAKFVTGLARGKAYLKENGEFWAYRDLDSKLHLVHRNVQRIYNGGHMDNCFISQNGKMHLWINEGAEVHTVDLPGEVTNNNNIENHLFQIRGNQLVTKVPLDFEKQSSHSILVRWKGDSGVEGQNAFAIQVKEQPEAPTRIGITPRATLKENAEKGAIVGQLYAMDSDQNDQHSFMIVDQSNSKPHPNNDPFEEPVKNPEINPWTKETNLLFAIQKGPFGKQFLVVKPSIYRDYFGRYLDYEKHPIVPVYIRATDSKGLFLEQVVEIKLEDVNERPSDIVIIRPGVKVEEQYLDLNRNSLSYPYPGYLKRTVDFEAKTITESLKPESTVGELVAKVRDEKDELNFDLVDHPSGISHDNHLFQIVKQSTGQSYLTVAPDAQFKHKDNPILTINIRVRDQTNLESMDQIQLEVRPAFTLELQAKKITSEMKPGDVVGTFLTNAPAQLVQLTGILDLAYNATKEILFMKGDGTVWKLKEFHDHLRTPARYIVPQKADNSQNQSSYFDVKLPWLLKRMDENFNFSSSGIYRFEVRNSKASFRKYETTQLPGRIEEIKRSGKKISLTYIDAKKIQAIATGDHSAYFIKDDGTLWQWERSPAPEQIRTNPSSIQPGATFNTFFRIFGDELRLAKKIPEDINEMKIHVAATNPEGLRIEEVFTLEVDRE